MLNAGIPPIFNTGLLELPAFKSSDIPTNASYWAHLIGPGLKFVMVIVPLTVNVPPPIDTRARLLLVTKPPVLPLAEFRVKVPFTVTLSEDAATLLILKAVTLKT